MSTLHIVLDAGPLSLATQRMGHPEGEACRKWLSSHLGAGSKIIVPEIADYEVRRELIRSAKQASIRRLDSFIAAVPDRLLRLTSPALRRAAELWALARNQGIPTASPEALDGDVILAAQVLTATLGAATTVVATTNVAHLSRFLNASPWDKIAAE